VDSSARGAAVHPVILITVFDNKKYQALELWIAIMSAWSLQERSPLHNSSSDDDDGIEMETIAGEEGFEIDASSDSDEEGLSPQRRRLYGVLAVGVLLVIIAPYIVMGVRKETAGSTASNGLNQFPSEDFPEGQEENGSPVVTNPNPSPTEDSGHQENNSPVVTNPNPNPNPTEDSGQQENESPFDPDDLTWRPQPGPFSTLNPVDDLNLFSFQRAAISSPSLRLDPLRDGIPNLPLPTNAWYQNLLALALDEEPTADHRAYPVPYVVDVSGKIPGLRIHAPPRIVATDTIVNLAVDEAHSLTLGATADSRQEDIFSVKTLGYSIRSATDLGVTLEWVGAMREIF
jgi:hypothetical protein